MDPLAAAVWSVVATCVASQGDGFRYTIGQGMNYSMSAVPLSLFLHFAHIQQKLSTGQGSAEGLRKEVKEDPGRWTIIVGRCGVL
jgi:hypothetical protein